MNDHVIFSENVETGPYLVAALYHFVSVPRFRELREPLQALCEANDVKGTLLLAHEGINGTIAGPENGIRAVLAFLRSQPEFSALEHKESWALHGEAARTPSPACVMSNFRSVLPAAKGSMPFMMNGAGRVSPSCRNRFRRKPTIPSPVPIRMGIGCVFPRRKQPDGPDARPETSGRRPAMRQGNCAKGPKAVFHRA